MLEVGYLVSEYPALSHTFIEREVLALRELGARVETFSVRAWDGDRLLSADMRAEAARTTVLQRRGLLVEGQRELLSRAPAGYAQVLAKALRTGRFSLKSRVWQGFYHAEAVALYRAMREAGLRHVHVHFANNGADIARLAVALGRAVDGPGAGWRWSFTMHGPTEFEEVERFDLPAKVRDADAVACITDFTRSQLMRMAEPQAWDKLSVVRMSVDTRRFAPPDGGRPAHGEPLRVLNVGRLVPEKGAPVLLEALGRLSREGVPVQARIVGAGPMRDLLQRRIDELGLGERVTLTGPVGQDDLPALYHWADVFVLPSFQEGLPVVLMEAQSSGLPVVTTAIAGIGELVTHGESGFVLPAGRADLVAGALSSLAADGETRERMGAAGRRAVLEAHSSEGCALVLRDFLQSVRPRDTGRD